MVRPAGRVTWYSKCHGSGWIGSGSVQNLTGRVGLVQEVFKPRGSGQVGSGQETLKSSRVGSDHEPREAVHSRVGPAWPASCFLLNRGSDTRIRLAGPILESLPAVLPKGFIRTNTQSYSFGIIFKNENTGKLIYIYTHICTHLYPVQPCHISLRGSKMNIK